MFITQIYYILFLFFKKSSFFLKKIFNINSAKVAGRINTHPPLLLRSKYNIQEEFIIRQFYFHKTYSDVIGGFTNAEAGAFIKKLCKFMFLDEKLQANAKDKVTSILILLSDGLTEKKNGTCTTRSKGKRFTFKSVYANVFYSLNDTNAGILIKQFATLCSAEMKYTVKN